MNWYKTSQQELLFNPFENAYNTNIRANPSRRDNLGNNYYSCNFCKKEMLEDEVAYWYDSPHDLQYRYPIHNIDKEQLKKEITNLAAAILPYIQKFESELSQVPKENAWDFEYDYVVNVPNIVNILQNSPNLKEYAQFKLALGYYYNKPPFLQLYTNIKDGSISVREIKELKDFASNPQQFFENIDNIETERNFRVKQSLPICKECLDQLPKCAFCDSPILDTSSARTTTWSDTEYACDKCIDNGNIEICNECGKADYGDEMHYVEDIGSYCESCFEDKKKDYNAFYREEINRIAEDNPQPFQEWFDGQNKVYIQFERTEDASSDDFKVIMFLESKGWTTSLTDYRSGYAFSNGRKIRIGKLLNDLQKKEIKNKDVLSQKDISDEYNIIKEKFDQSRFRKIKTTSGLQIVVSQDPQDIAKMSTGRGWTSCMNMEEGSRQEQVYCEVREGGLIAYLIKKGDENIEEPLARVLIRRYANKDGKSIAMVEDKYYGNAPTGFIEQVKAWVATKQQEKPKGSYHQKGMGWTDTLERQYEYAQKILRWLKMGNTFTSWYKIAKQLPLFDNNAPKNEPYKRTESGLRVFVDSANSYGNMTLIINGKKYKYELPYSAVELGNSLRDYQVKGWGKQVKRMIDGIDRYRVK